MACYTLMNKDYQVLEFEYDLKYPQLACEFQ